MLQESPAAMARTRALMTETERRRIAGGADVAVLKDRHPELFDGFRAVVRGDGVY